MRQASPNSGPHCGRFRAPRTAAFLLVDVTRMFEHIRGDFNAHHRHWGAQGFWALLVYRFGRWRIGLRPRLLRRLLYPLYLLLEKLVQVCAGIELPCEVEIGKNFVI